MSNQTKAEEFRLWVESLRDRVGRVPGRRWEGGDSGFNSELKGELLDAIDLLLEHASPQEPSIDPVQTAVEEFSNHIGKLVEQTNDSYHKRLAHLEHELEQKFNDWTGQVTEICQASRVSDENTREVLESLQHIPSRVEARVERCGHGLEELICSTLNQQFSALRLAEEQEAASRETSYITESEWQELQATNESLRQQLDELMHGDDSGAEGDIEAQEQLAADLEEAMQQIADLQHESESLREQLAKKQGAASTGAAPAGNSDNMSWEERKRLMLQQLEGDESRPEDQQQRIEIDQLIAQTESELSSRDEEIQRLRQQIEEMSESDQSAAQEILNSDQIIQDERAKLQAMQREWEEKLRRAEIDISIERAKIARERTELDKELAKVRNTSETVPPDDHDAPPRPRRWLDHLGLRDDSKNDS